MGNVSEEDRAYITELVKRAQKNDSNAFAELYTMTYETEYAFSRKYMRDDDYAQDVLQEVYILALKNIGNLKEPKYFFTWLRQINFRICHDDKEKAADRVGGAGAGNSDRQPCVRQPGGGYDDNGST